MDRPLRSHADGTRYFEGKLVSVTIDFATRRSVPIPPDLRARAEAYAAAHPVD